MPSALAFLDLVLPIAAHRYGIETRALRILTSDLGQLVSALLRSAGDRNNEWCRSTEG